MTDADNIMRKGRKKYIDDTEAWALSCYQLATGATKLSTNEV